MLSEGGGESNPWGEGKIPSNVIEIELVEETITSEMVGEAVQTTTKSSRKIVRFK